MTIYSLYIFDRCVLLLSLASLAGSACCARGLSNLPHFSRDLARSRSGSSPSRALAPSQRRDLLTSPHSLPRPLAASLRSAARCSLTPATATASTTKTGTARAPSAPHLRSPTDPACIASHNPWPLGQGRASSRRAAGRPPRAAKHKDKGKVHNNKGKEDREGLGSKGARGNGRRACRSTRRPSSSMVLS